MPRYTFALDDLMPALTDAPPADEVERGYVAAFAQLLERWGHEALRRTTFAPGHITASAFVVDAARSRLLLIEHPVLSMWLQPGGHIEPGETDLCKAALREVYEETGYTELSVLDPMPFDVDVHAIPARPEKGEPAHQHFDVRFLFAADDAVVESPPEHLPVAWVPFGEVPRVTDDDSVRRAVRKIQRLS